MNDEHPPLEAIGEGPLEARVVAWVLGEASAFESAELERLCRERPELELFRRRMLALHGLLAEIGKPSADEDWKLSPTKRSAIEESLGQPEAPGAADREQRIRRSGRRAIFAIAACALVTAIMIGLLWDPPEMPALSEAMPRYSAPALSAPEEGEAGPTPRAQLQPQAEPLFSRRPLAPGSYSGLEFVPGQSQPATRLAELGELQDERLLDPSAGARGEPTDLAANSSRFRSATAAPARALAEGVELDARQDGLDHFADPQSGPALGGLKSELSDLLASGVRSGDHGVSRNNIDAIPNIPVPPAAAEPQASREANVAGMVIDEATKAQGVDEIRRKLYVAEGNYNLGKYDDAKSEYEDALRIDPNNSAARRGMERIAAAKSDYYRAAYDHTRAELLMQVDEAWERAAPAETEPAESGVAAAEPAQALASGPTQFGSSVEPKSESLSFNSAGELGDVLPNLYLYDRDPAENGLGRDDFANQEPWFQPMPAEDLVRQRIIPPPPGQPGSSIYRDLAGPIDEELDVEGPEDPEAELDRFAQPDHVERLELRRQQDFREALRAELSPAEHPYSTFSLHLSDASFQLARAALARGERPDPAQVRPEQFYNAVDYGDPAPSGGERIAGFVEQSAHPVLPARNLIRVALKTAAAGRSAGQPLRLTLLVDQSGSMVREDRRQALAAAVRQLATLLGEQDRVNVIGFSRTPRLLEEALQGNFGARLPELIGNSPDEGGTNLEEALKLAHEIAGRHHDPAAQNRVVLLTDGAANLGDANPERLASRVKAMRQQGLALDVAGIGIDGLNDQLLSELARNGNGRYYLVEESGDAFARQLAGAFRPAAEDVKVQVIFNPERVASYQLLGFEEHRLRPEDFRNNQVDAAELAAEEAGVALYQVQPLPEGRGEIGEITVRFRDAASGRIVERTWTIPYQAAAPAFDVATPSMQLAGMAYLAAEKLRGGSLADAIDFKTLSQSKAAVKHYYGDSRKVSHMIDVITALE